MPLTLADAGSNTLDELIALNLIGYGHCPACGRSVKFDLPALRVAYGGDKRLSDLVMEDAA